MIVPCLTRSDIRYISRVRWSNAGRAVAPSPTPRCSIYWKRNSLITLDYGRRQLFTLPRRLTLHLSDTSSITQDLKKHSCPSTEFRKILTENNDIRTTSKNYRFSRRYILEIYNPNWIELILNVELMYLNVFSYRRNFIETNLQSKCYTIHK